MNFATRGTANGLILTSHDEIAHAHTTKTLSTSGPSWISPNSLLYLHKSKMWWYICHQWTASNCFTIGLGLKWQILHQCLRRFSCAKNASGPPLLCNIYYTCDLWKEHPLKEIVSFNDGENCLQVVFRLLNCPMKIWLFLTKVDL